MLVHLVFSTKQRKPFLQGELAREMHAYLGGTLRELGCPCLCVNGMPDHVHLLFNLDRKLALATVVERIKTNSSAWIKTKSSGLELFQWQAGYGAFSIGASQVEDACEYINNQAEHHKTRTFEDEFRTLLQKYGNEWDERYVWD